MVVAARHENAHVDAVARRAVERFDLRRRRREVRRRDPDRALGRDRLDLQRARDAQPQRLALDDADERRRRASAGSRCAPRAARRRKRCEPRRSRPLRRARHMCRTPATMSRAAGPSMRTAVSRQRDAVALVHAGRPFAADADAAGDADRSVDDEQLAVIARDEPEPARKPGRVEDATSTPGRFSALMKLPRRAAAADPVEEQPNRDAARRRARSARRRSARRPRRSGRCSSRARPTSARAVDELEHRVEGRRAVAQQRDAIAARHVGRRDAPETARERRAAGATACVVDALSWRAACGARSGCSVLAASAIYSLDYVPCIDTTGTCRACSADRSASCWSQLATNGSSSRSSKGLAAQAGRASPDWTRRRRRRQDRR